jgi:hypothetical protein
MGVGHVPADSAQHGVAARLEAVAHDLRLAAARARAAAGRLLGDLPALGEIALMELTRRIVVFSCRSNAGYASGMTGDLA